MTTYQYNPNTEKIDVWETIKNQIERSLRKRYNWKLILGDTLTRTILRYKMQGLDATATLQEILENPILERIKENYKGVYDDMIEKIRISVCARFGENDSALRLFNQEFKDKSVVEKNETNV